MPSEPQTETICAKQRNTACPFSAAGRVSDLSKANPNFLARFLLDRTDEVKKTAKQTLKDAKSEANCPQKLTSQSEANLFAAFSIEALLKLANDAGIAQ